MRKELIQSLLSALIIATFLLSCDTKPQQRFETVTFQNPILPGFYPDPSVCKGPDGYYMVNSTFSYFPGIPIFYSPDLVHWEQIGNVMSRPDQLQLDGLGISTDGIYAPTIEYNNGKFYVACTLVRGKGNFIVTADDPAGPWSDPYWLPQVDGIDPSLFFNDDGRTYLVFNSNPPENNPLYDGHRTIRMFEMDMEKMAVKGEEKILINGGVDITQSPAWIEGPHIYKVEDYYYISAAEGGTSVNHRQVIFRSDDVDGSYIPWEKNPILTQMHLDPTRANSITSTGHADLIQDLKGNWWAVFLACRPYEGNHYNLGRETYMAPVRWEDGWPIINPDNEEVQYSYQFDAALKTPQDYKSLSGSFVKRDEFVEEELDLYWLTIRTPYENWYMLRSQDDGILSMQVRPYSLLEKENPSFIGRRQQHLRSSATTEIRFSPASPDEKGGITIFQNVGHFYYLCKSLDDNQPVVQLFQSLKDGGMELLDQKILSENSDLLKLKIESQKDHYRCYFAEGDEGWQAIGSDLDAKLLSTETAGGFNGCLYGMFAANMDDNTVSSSIVNYYWFEYEGDDEGVVR